MRTDLLSQRTTDLLALADVHRWCVVKTMRTQSVAEHSFAVAIIAVELSERLHIRTEDLVWIALTHDYAEVYTGDIDGKFKCDNPEAKAVIKAAECKPFSWRHYHSEQYPIEEAIVKVADKIEALVWVKVWGVGSRADDVYQELWRNLIDTYVPLLASVVGWEVEHAEDTVRVVYDSCINEHHGVQFRKLEPDA